MAFASLFPCYCFVLDAVKSRMHLANGLQTPHFPQDTLGCPPTSCIQSLAFDTFYDMLLMAPRIIEDGILSLGAKVAQEGWQSKHRPEMEGRVKEQSKRAVSERGNHFNQIRRSESCLTAADVGL